jgi:hypothetical protein
MVTRDQPMYYASPPSKLHAILTIYCLKVTVREFLLSLSFSQLMNLYYQEINKRL